MIDSKTKALLEKGKAKMDARLEIVQNYLQGKKHKHKATSNVLKAGSAKRKARQEIVSNYLSGTQS